ncbi:CPBP family intramembrane glutamic endopeptidase [Streptococcus rifensis]
MIYVKKGLKIAGMIALAMALNIAPMVLIGNQANTPVPMRWLLSIVYFLVAVGIIGFTWKRYKTYGPESIKHQKFGWRDFGIAILFFLATRVLAVAGTYANMLYSGNATSANDAALMATNDQLADMFVLYFIAFHCAIGLFAPIFEELVFRGFMTKYFFKEDTKILPLVVTSVIFALPHATNIVEFAMYFGLGAIFYAAYLRRGNIKDSIAVHLLNNSLLVIISVISYILIKFNILG